MSDQQTNQQCAYRYTVRRGDSFYLIAQRQGVPLRDLMDANPGIPPARLMVGDVLCIPPCRNQGFPTGPTGPACPTGPSGSTPPTGPTVPTGPTTPTGPTGGYTCPANRRAVVQEGQTAGDLQIRYNLSYHTLTAANEGKDLENLRGGDIVCVPEENVPCSVPQTVVLGEGETLSTLADRYGKTTAALLRANPCLAPRDFRAGAAVRLPE